MDIHNLLYEHRKNVCKLMATEKMSQNKRDKLYWYTQELQQRINELSKNISFQVELVEPDPVQELGEITIKDYIEVKIS
jgi:predicted transcriptional regulator